MADRFITVRRKDDHTITHEIAERSLPIWSQDWEPVPDDTDQPEPARADQTPALAPVSDPTSSQSRSRAAKTPKE